MSDYKVGCGGSNSLVKSQESICNSGEEAKGKFGGRIVTIGNFCYEVEL